MALEDKLHDEIDALEDFRELALQVVAEVKAEAEDIAGRHEDFEGILIEIAQRVEAKLAALTTDAARSGLVAGKARVER